jgi:hypothetical protein
MRGRASGHARQREATMAAPDWYRQLAWSKPISIAALNVDRAVIPNFPGCYVFTEESGPLRPGGVLYVGEAKTALATRLPVYLVDFRIPKTGKDHKGKGFILEARSLRTDYGVFVRWVLYGGAGPDISLLESSLIDYLRPSCNDRDESARHGVLSDRDRLDPRLL